MRRGIRPPRPPPSPMICLIRIAPKPLSLPFAEFALKGPSGRFQSAAASTTVCSGDTAIVWQVFCLTVLLLNDLASAQRLPPVRGQEQRFI